MKKCLLISSFVVFGLYPSLAQQKIKDDSVTQYNLPNKDAILELASSNKGLLNSKVALTSTVEAFPLTAHVAGMMVYNTETNADVVPGIYYNNGSKWILAGAGIATGIKYNPKNYTISYLDADSNTVFINLKNVIKENEVITTLVDNKNGTYTYTSEDNRKALIDIPASVINHFKDIVNDNTVKHIIENIVGKAVGSILYDGTNFTYLDNTGKTQTINLKALVKSNQALTSLTYDDIKNALTYTDKDQVAHVLNLNSGGLSYDQTTNILTYTDGSGKKTDLGLSNPSLNYDKNKQELTYVDSKGAAQTVDLKELVKNSQALTSLTYDNIKNALTYTDKDQLAHVLNLNSGGLSYDQTTNVLTYTDGSGKKTDLGLSNPSLNYDKNKQELTYVDSKGTAQTVDLKELVKSSQALTSLTYDDIKNALTYTDKDQVGHVLNLNSGGLSYDQTTNILTYTDGSGKKTDLGLSNPALNYDKNKQELTYVDSKGAAQTVDLKELVKSSQALTSLTYDHIKNALTYTDKDQIAHVLNLNSGGLSYDQTTNVLTYTDGSGKKTDLGLSNPSLNYDKNKQELTYVDSKGAAQTIDLKELVKNSQTTTSISAGSGITVKVDGLAGNNLNYVVSTLPATNSTTGSIMAGKSLTVTTTGTLDVNADNGIALNAGTGSLQLGGALTKATEIATDANHTLALTGLQTGVASDKVLVTDAKTGILKKLDQPVATEPWLIQKSHAGDPNIQATSNTQAIYQIGNVAIGKESAAIDVALDVVGAVRFGSDHAGAVGGNSAAFGAENIVSGIDAVGFGYQNNVSGNTATAFGLSNIVSGYSATTFGNRNTASANNATTFGDRNTASGSGATAFGSGNITSGDYTTSFGNENKTVGYGATTFGVRNTALTPFETVLGYNNAIITSSVNSDDTAISGAEDIPLLQVGNGLFSDNGVRLGKNALTILRNGNVGIGIVGTEDAAKPTEMLDIGSGNVKIRNINTIAGTVTDKIVVADATGVLKTIDRNIQSSTPSIIKKTSDYTAKPTDETILVDAGSGNLTITLPDNLEIGKKYTIKTIGASPDGRIFINPSNGGKIDDERSVLLFYPYQNITIQFDGTNWWIISGRIEIQVSPLEP